MRLAVRRRVTALRLAAMGAHPPDARTRVEIAVACVEAAGATLLGAQGDGEAVAPRRRLAQGSSPGLQPTIDVGEAVALRQAYCLIRARAWESAADLLGAALVARPSSTRCRACLHYVNGWIVLAAGDVGLARHEWMAALELDETMSAARNALRSSDDAGGALASPTR